MKIGFLLKRQEYAHSSPVMADVFQYLRRASIQVKTIIPEADIVDLASFRNDCDLYVLKPGVDMALSLALVLHEQGARIINSYPASAAVQDKVFVTARLISAGIPTPRSFVTGNLQNLYAQLNSEALIVKPHRGSYGEGIEIFPRSELPAQAIKGGCFSQEYLDSDGEDLKVYVIGKEVFAVKKKFPASSYEEKLGRPVQVDNYIRGMALQIGKLFDLSVFGIDIIETPDGPYVVDVNFFPGFIGVPQAGEKIAEFLLDCLSAEVAEIYNMPRSLAST